MAAATVTATEYGYSVTGGTDATTIDSGRLRVKLLAFAGNADNATAALTSLVNSSAVSCCKFKTNGNDLDAAANKLWFGEGGSPFTGLAVTLSNASDVLYVYIV